MNLIDSFAEESQNIAKFVISHRSIRSNINMLIIHTIFAAVVLFSVVDSAAKFRKCRRPAIVRPTVQHMLHRFAHTHSRRSDTMLPGRQHLSGANHDQSSATVSERPEGPEHSAPGSVAHQFDSHYAGGDESDSDQSAVDRSAANWHQQRSHRQSRVSVMFGILLVSGLC